MLIDKRQSVGLIWISLVPCLAIVIMPGAGFGPHHPVAAVTILKLEFINFGYKGRFTKLTGLKILT